MIIRIQQILDDLAKGILALIKVILLSHFKEEIVYTKRNKSCIILGNGPSLKHSIKDHPEFLENKDIFCVNHFPSTEFYSQIKPHYYITSAPDLWLDNIDERFIINRGSLFSKMAQKTDWPIEFIVPFEAEKFTEWKKDLIRNKNIDFKHFNNIGIEGWQSLRHFLYRKNWAMPRPHNVVISAIYVAINLGYKEIFIWGAEHTQFKEIIVDENNNALINQKHFYDPNDLKAQPLDKRGLGKRKVHEILYKFMVAFRSYFILKDYARSRGVKIFNATPGSLIDAFERYNFNKEKT